MTRHLYAHRGASKEHPENTLEAFHRALEVGATALEMDCHMTADGHVVVSHDGTGERMCAVAKAIRECSLAEVKSWDCGTGFRDANGGSARGAHRIPTLAEVLEACPDTLINIDLKQPTPTMVPSALVVLRDHSAESRVTLASFDRTTIQNVRDASYQGLTALARSEATELILTPGFIRRLRPLSGDVAQLPTRLGPIALPHGYLIKKAHALGLRIDFWTVNDPHEAVRLFALGADGVMTDDPATVAAAPAVQAALKG
jgi:glycerophosphoryl diester phosphodiesterase